MPKISFTVPDEEAGSALSRLPGPAKARLRKGFSVVSSLSAPQIDVLLEPIRDAFEGGPRQIGDEFLSAVKLDRESAEAALTAFSLTASFLVATDASADEFVRGAVEAGLVDPPARSSVEDLARKFIAQRTELKSLSRRGELADEVLPSLERVEASIDIRVAIEGTSIITVPVAVVLIDTDAQGERIFFQMTKSQVEEIAKQFSELLKNMHTVERIIPSKVSN